MKKSLFDQDDLDAVHMKLHERTLSDDTHIAALHRDSSPVVTDQMRARLDHAFSGGDDDD